MKLGEIMKKQDKIDLAIGKCFANSNLNEEECELIQAISILELATKHGLNENQSNLVKSWCKLSQQKMINQEKYDRYSEETSIDSYDVKFEREE
jgi:hypothetical protein